MKRSRSSETFEQKVQRELDAELDPLALALLMLGGGGGAPQHAPEQQLGGALPMPEQPSSKRGRPRKPSVAASDADAGDTSQSEGGPSHRHSSSGSGRRGYVWRGPHREELTMHKKQYQQQYQQQYQYQQLDAAEGVNSSSRRSSATHGLPSDDDEVAQQQHPHHHSSSSRRPPKQQQQQQHGKDRGKEWAALTTWLRMNLHHPRTSKRVLLFVGEQDATGCWRFSLNPEVSWQEVGLETKLRLKTLLVEAEQAYLQKYPGHPRLEWASKLQRYKPPGRNITVDITLWDVINGLHSIYLQHEDPTANNLAGQLQHHQHQLHAGLDPPQHHQQMWMQLQHSYGADGQPLLTEDVPGGLPALQQQQPELLQQEPEGQQQQPDAVQAAAAPDAGLLRPTHRSVA